MAEQRFDFELEAEPEQRFDFEQEEQEQQFDFEQADAAGEFGLIGGRGADLVERGAGTENPLITGALTGLQIVDRPRNMVAAAAQEALHGGTVTDAMAKAAQGARLDTDFLWSDWIREDIREAREDPVNQPFWAPVLEFLDKHSTIGKSVEALTDENGQMIVDPTTGAPITVVHSESDTVDRTLAAAFGFGADVASDPITYVPFGVIPSVLKNGVKALGYGLKGAKALVPTRAVMRVAAETKAFSDSFASMFSTRFGLHADPRFAEMETRLKDVALMARERAVRDNAPLRRELDKIAKEFGLNKNAVRQYVTNVAERGFGNVSVRNLTPEAERMLATDPRIRSYTGNLRRRNAEQLQIEMQKGILQGGLGTKTANDLRRIDGALTSARPGQSVINPLTGKEVSYANLTKLRAKVAADVQRNADIDYFAHSATPEFREWLSRRPGHKGPRRGGYEISKRHASTLERKLRGMDINEINAQAARGQLPGFEGFKGKAFEDDPAIIQTIRDIRHTKTVAIADAMNFAGTTWGKPVTEIMTAAKRAGADPQTLRSREASLRYLRQQDPDNYGDMVFPQNPILAQYAMPEEMAKRIDKHYDVFFGKDKNAFLDTVDTVTRWWKAWTLSVFPSYHTRNAASNIFNNHIVGVDMGAYKEAIKYQRGRADFTLTIEAGPNKGTTLARDTIQNLIDDGRLGIRGRGFMATDIEQSLRAELGESRWLSLSTNARAIMIGRRVGTAIEDNARIANFLDGLKKGMSPEDAASRVRTALFDYQDLTDFEQKVMKRIFPFYTWTRKNIPFHVTQMLDKPGRYKKFDTLRRDVEAQTRPDLKPDERLLQDWMLEAYPTRVGVDGEGNPVYWLANGYIPAADVWKFATAPQRVLADNLHPAAKVIFEQAIWPRFSKEGKILDSYSGREFDPHLKESFLGMRVSPRIKLAFRNIRALAELDNFLNAAAHEHPELAAQLGLEPQPQNIRASKEQLRTLEEVMLNFMAGIHTYSVDYSRRREQEARNLTRDAAQTPRQRARSRIMKGLPKDPAKARQEILDAIMSGVKDIEKGVNKITPRRQ